MAKLQFVFDRVGDETYLTVEGMVAAGQLLIDQIDDEMFDQAGDQPVGMFRPVAQVVLPTADLIRFLRGRVPAGDVHRLAPEAEMLCNSIAWSE